MRLFRRLTKKEWKEIGEKYKGGGVHTYRGKKTLFYNGEELWEGRGDEEYLIKKNNEERKSWEVIIVLPGVRDIPPYTFSACRNVKTVIMSDTVKRIEKEAFQGCGSLVFVKLSRNLEYIGGAAFWMCESLTSVFIPPSCRVIRDDAFAGCKSCSSSVFLKQLNLVKKVFESTALMKRSPFEGDNYFFESDKVNEWVKKDHHEDFPLHKICCSENPILNQEYTTEDWIKEDDCTLTPLHYLSCNPHVNIDIIQNIIQQNQSAFIGSDDAKLGESLLFKIAAFLPIRFSALQCFIDMYPRLREVNNAKGQTLQEVREHKYDPPTKETKSFGKNDVGLNDNPKKTPDRLGYSIYAEGVSKIAQDAEKSGTYFCVGLLGPWGSGKTKLWNLIKENLESFTEEEQQNNDDKDKPTEEKQNHDDKCKSVEATIEQSITLLFRSYIAFLEKSSCLKKVDQESVEASRKYENEMRNEAIALIVIITVIITFPFLLLFILYRCCRGKEEDGGTSQASLDLKNKANTIADLILGRKQLYYSFSKTRPFTFIALLRRFVLVPVRVFFRISRMAAGSLLGIAKLIMCRSQCSSRTDSSKKPKFSEKPKYIFAEFNAWTYNGSDNLWASLVEQLYTVVEEEFSPLEVRLHRASIDLLKKYSKDNDNDEEEGVDKEEERAGALFRFYWWTIMSFALAIIGVAIGIWLFLDSRNEDDGSDVEARPRGTYFIGQIGGITFLTMSPIPLLKQLFIFLKDILPILRQGHRQLIQSAIFGKRFRRRDFSSEMGFMSEVKTEIEYLFDFLQVTRKYDKASKATRPVRLCVFVDDLDRCNAQTVVSVLEAVFLLLSESPITCYLAIDTRLVVASIDEHYTVHDRAGINGYDFLEKIIQLPFCVPDLTDSKKKAFINRLFLSGQLNPLDLCSTITNLKKSSNLYPDIDKFSEVTPELNEANALIHLAKEFVKLHREQVPLGYEHNDLLLDYGLVEEPERIALLSKAQKESFLFHAAYHIQQIQEAEEEKKAGIEGEVNKVEAILFLSGQLNSLDLCSTITNLKKSSNLYLDIDEFYEVTPELNEANALIHLAKEFVKLHKEQVPLGDEYNDFLLDYGLVEEPERIALLSKAQKESFLFHAAYHIQQIQEAEEEKKAGIEGEVNKVEAILFLIGQLNSLDLCSTITNLKKSSNLYPDIDEIYELTPELNEHYALIHLAKEFVKLHREQVPLSDEHNDLLLDYGLVEFPERIAFLSKAQKESFLFHAAYHIQQIQEAEEEKKAGIEGEVNKDWAKVKDSNYERSIEREEQKANPTISQDDKNEEDNIEVHEIDFMENFPWDTKLVEAAVPLNSMMTPIERKWFTEYVSYVSGKPRCITRVVNCYNLARYVAEKVTPEALYKNAITVKRKLMKLIILSEFWPYRTAFLMQVAEDIMQLSSLQSRNAEEHLDETGEGLPIMQLSDLQGRNVDHFDKKGEGLSLYDILPKLINSCQKKERYEEVSLLCLYNRVVEPLLHSATNPREAEKMLARDGDPQLFEHLLSSDVKSDLLKVKDIVVPFNDLKVERTNESIHLRYFVLNMSRHMLEYCSRCLDNLILYTEERYSFFDKCKREVLMYKHKHKYFTSGETPIDTTNKAEKTNEEGNDEPQDNPQDNPRSSNENSREVETSSQIETKEKARHDVIFIRVKNAEDEIEKVIKCQMDEETTLAEHLETSSTRCTRSVHIDDDLFIWNEIKNWQAYYLPTLCGSRKMFTFTFVEEQKAKAPQSVESVEE